MLDIRMIRENPEKVKQGMKKRCLELDSVVDSILEIDVKRRELSTKTDQMKSEQNSASKQIPMLKKQGQDVSEILAKMKTLSDEITKNASEVAKLEEMNILRFLDLLNHQMLNRSNFLEIFVKVCDVVRECPDYNMF